MKIILVSQSLPPAAGGIQNYSHHLALQFSKWRDVTVIYAGAWRKRAGDRQQPYKKVFYPIGNTYLFCAMTPWAIARVAGKNNARIVYHTHYATGFGSLIAKRLGLIDRYYVAAHAREIVKNNFGPIHHKWRDLLLRNAAGIFAVSRYTGNLIRGRGIPEEKVHIVPNGVDLNIFYPREKMEAKKRLGLTGKRIILTVSRLVKRKGIDTTIKALSYLDDTCSDLVYLIVGNGPYRKQLIRLAQRHSGSQRIIFTGPVPDEDLPFFYSAADIFVMPSREEKGGCVEGFGLVFLEANACRTPVIGTRSGGIPDAVEEGVSGLLVRPDDPEDLAGAIKKLLTDDTLRSTLAQKGRERSLEYSWDNCAKYILKQIEHRKK